MYIWYIMHCSLAKLAHRHKGRPLSWVEDPVGFAVDGPLNGSQEPIAASWDHADWISHAVSCVCTNCRVIRSYHARVHPGSSFSIWHFKSMDICFQMILLNLEQLAKVFLWLDTNSDRQILAAQVPQGARIIQPFAHVLLSRLHKFVLFSTAR